MDMTIKSRQHQESHLWKHRYLFFLELCLRRDVFPLHLIISVAAFLKSFHPLTQLAIYFTLLSFYCKCHVTFSVTVQWLFLQPQTGRPGGGGGGAGQKWQIPHKSMKQLSGNLCVSYVIFFLMSFQQFYICNLEWVIPPQNYKNIISNRAFGAT